MSLIKMNDNSPFTYLSLLYLGSLALDYNWTQNIYSLSQTYGDGFENITDSDSVKLLTD